MAIFLRWDSHRTPMSELVERQRRSLIAGVRFSRRRFSCKMKSLCFGMGLVLPSQKNRTTHVSVTNPFPVSSSVTDDEEKKKKKRLLFTVWNRDGANRYSRFVTMIITNRIRFGQPISFRLKFIDLFNIHQAFKQDLLLNMKYVNSFTLIGEHLYLRLHVSALLFVATFPS